MDRCENNRKVALSRWRNVRARGFAHLALRAKEPEYRIHLARLLAYIAADGSMLTHTEKNVTRRHADIRFYPDDDEMVRLCSQSMEYLYGKTPTVRKLQGYYRMYLSSQVAVVHLQVYGPFGATAWRAPFVTLLSQACKREWLRAFFDCEGYVGKRCIRVESVNQRGLDDVQKLLEEFGILSRRYVYVRQNKNWGVNYILNIGTLQGRRTFLKEIGFSHTLKIEKLRSQLSRPA